MAVYVIAMYCYGAELAFGSPRRSRLTTIAREPERELVAAGASSTYAGNDATVDAALSDAGAEAALREAKASRLGRVAVSLTVLGFVLHAGSVLARGISAGRPPWGNMFEF